MGKRHRLKSCALKRIFYTKIEVKEEKLKLIKEGEKIDD
jgi:hypothetical protein